jgi:type I restriction enzyme S subunit
MPILLPPRDEQRRIADLLDHETAKIDALVQEQQRLIELLKEKRQAVISQAVTKGLNPNVPMRGSGAGWIGQVPQHWRVSALGYAARIDSGSTPDRANPNFWGGNIPWVKTGEVNYDPISQAEECITEAGLQGSSAKVAPPGTLLMAMYGQGVTRGRVALLEVPAAYNQACAAIHFDLAVAPSFGRYFFMAAYEHVRDGGNETSQMNLSTGAIQKFKITVPPTPEQLAIVEFLDSSIREIELLIEHGDQSLILLSERRSALISAAVTGKIDVRNLAPQPEAVGA